MVLLLILMTGLIVGAVAKFVMPGPDPGGFIITTLLGIAGAFVGGFISQAVGLGEMGSIGSFVAAVVGAVLLLFVYRKFKGGARQWDDVPQQKRLERFGWSSPDAVARF